MTDEPLKIPTIAVNEPCEECSKPGSNLKYSLAGITGVLCQTCLQQAIAQVNNALDATKNKRETRAQGEQAQEAGKINTREMREEFHLYLEYGEDHTTIHNESAFNVVVKNTRNASQALMHSYSVTRAPYSPREIILEVHRVIKISEVILPASAQGIEEDEEDEEF